MRKLLCLAWSLCAVVLVNAQLPVKPSPVNAGSPYSQISKEDQQQLEKMVPANAKAARPAPKAKKRALGAESTDTVSYFVAAQSTKANYSFVPEGGDILTYEMGIVRDGNTVTFHNFFNLYNPADYSPSLDIPSPPRPFLRTVPWPVQSTTTMWVCSRAASSPRPVR